MSEDGKSPKKLDDAGLVDLIDKRLEELKHKVSADLFWGSGSAPGGDVAGLGAIKAD